MIGKEKLRSQYSNSKKLEARIELHNRFSVNRFGWTNWISNQFLFDNDMKILELGCGTGSFWKVNADKIPQMDIIVSDISKGMIEKTKENLVDTSLSIQYEIIDAHNIPFEEDCFDVVIANHMIYHLDDIDKGIKEIKRVLKPGGSLYGTTFGYNNMKELYDILKDYEKDTDFPAIGLAERFGLESGEVILQKYFNNVECRRYVDSLEVTDIEVLIEYVLSMDMFMESENEEMRFRSYMNSRMDEMKKIVIQKDSGMLVAR